MEFYEYGENRIIEMIKSGAIFIYPTDTVYGMGCNAENHEAVNRIKQLKGRDINKPLSIITPSKEWISDNLIADNNLIDKYLPGKYTLILKKKNPEFLSHVSPTDTIGIRIPNHEFAQLVAKANVPFITTSINLSGEKPASNLADIKPEILNQADIIINSGQLAGTPSAIILPNGEELKR
jgi:L-threonylcarbamoyladenylate synthase